MLILSKLFRQTHQDLKLHSPIDATVFSDVYVWGPIKATDGTVLLFKPVKGKTATV